MTLLNPPYDTQFHLCVHLLILHLLLVPEEIRLRDVGHPDRIVVDSGVGLGRHASAIEDGPSLGSVQLKTPRTTHGILNIVARASSAKVSVILHKLHNGSGGASY